MKKKLSIWAWLGIIVGGFVLLNTISFFIFHITIIPLNANNAASNLSEMTTTAPQQTKSPDASLALKELKDDELISAVKKDNKYGFIDTSGKFVIEPKFDYASNFSEGYALVRLSDKAGFIDKTGNIVIDLGNAVDIDDCDMETFIYKNSGIDFVGLIPNSSFHEGLAHISYATEGSKYPKCRYVDKNGKTVLDGYTYADDFKNGIALVALSVTDKGWVKDYTYIDSSGKQLFDKTFEIAFSFSDGLACVKDSNGKWGYINIKGDWVIPPHFESSGSPFSEGYAMVYDASVVTNDNFLTVAAHYFIDKTGQPVFDGKHFRQFAETSQYTKFYDGIACVISTDGKPMYIDTKGNTVIDMPSKYKYEIAPVSPFINGYAFIYVDGKQADFIIDKNQKIIAQGLDLDRGQCFAYVNKPEAKEEYPIIPASVSNGNETTTGSNPKTLSMEWYNKTQNGMTYDEVCQITGSKGECIMSTQYQAMYRWYGNNGDYITYEFFNGKLVNHGSIASKEKYIYVTELYAENKNDKYKNDPLANTFWRQDAGSFSEKFFLRDWFINYPNNKIIWFLPNGTGVLFDNVDGIIANPNKPNIKWKALGKDRFDDYKYSVTFEDGTKLESTMYEMQGSFYFTIGDDYEDAHIRFTACNDIVQMANK